MNVSLTPELERLIHDRVATGRYSSASEVVREALRTLEKQDQTRQLHLDRLRLDVRAGLDALHQGHTQPGGETFDELVTDLGRPRQQG